MTSVLRRFAQIDPRVQYFTVMDASGADAWTPNTNQKASSIMTVSDVSGAFTKNAGYFAPVSLLKDLGRQVTVYDPTQTGAPHVALLRQVMLVAQGAPEWEGISSNIGYICVWAADGSGTFSPAFVSRTG